MNFFTDDFKEQVFKGIPISDCFQMKIVLWFSNSLRNSWECHYKCCVKYQKHLKTSVEFAKNANGGLHFSAKLKTKG